MSMRTLQTAILAEARTVLCNPKLRLKDIIEWSTGDVEAEYKEEISLRLPQLAVGIVVKDIHDKRPKAVPCEMCGDAPCKGCNKCCGSKLGRDPEDGSCLGCG